MADPDATIAQLQTEMAAGRLTSRALTVAHIDRIHALDQRGPSVTSVLELNPDAVQIAGALDEERVTDGARGPLHGIPVLVKDNIATTDRMGTTAGSLALVGIRPTREAHLVTRLREAGAVILGKANMSEWANFRSTRPVSGWSARGGLTRNPYALDRSASGSSSGSAAAVAAGFTVVAVGTETNGSIVSPASKNGVVGFKPTVGLVSRDGIIPISNTQDTAGPIARCVADAAALLRAIAGPDPHDVSTRDSRAATDESRLDGRALAGARLGVVRSSDRPHRGVDHVFEQALAALAAQGAILVDPVDLTHSGALADAEAEVLLHELKAGLAAWLSEFAPNAPISNLADLIAWNERHRDTEMPWFGQELFELADSRGDLSDAVYLEALSTCRRLARGEGIDATLARDGLDALVAPTTGPAPLIDLINGDYGGGGFSRPAAVAGYPHLTVPAGFVHGLPVGLSFVGPAWSDGLLMTLGFAFEQATRARRPPTFATTLV